MQGMREGTKARSTSASASARTWHSSDGRIPEDGPGMESKVAMEGEAKEFKDKEVRKK